MATSNSREKLFQDFPPISTKDWDEKIIQDLKGADYEKKLIWKTQEGFNVKPYYRQEDLDNIDYLNVLPDEFPYVRGNKKQNNDWEIRQDIKVEDVKEANQKALFVLDKGITSLGFDVPEGKINSQEDFSSLLKEVYFECIHLNFVTHKNAEKLFDFLVNEASQKNVELNNILGSTDYDPIGQLVTAGGFEDDKPFETATSFVKKAAEKLPNYKVIAINAQHYSNSGATIVQQLAFALAHGNEYLVKLAENGLSIDEITPRLQFKFGIAGNYFMEIAKLRAARMLWAKIVEAHKPSKQESAQMYIHSVTSDYNKTIYDPYVNMLRATTESMSAAIGGTDSMYVKPFDANFRKTSKFSGRIARNTQIILKEEAYFDKIVDPAAGSYYIEALTDSIAENAWKLFLKIEEKGGFIEAFKEGFIQGQVKASTDERDKLIATRREVYLGTNQYPNSQETIKEQIDTGLAFPEVKKSSNGVAEPLKLYRAAMPFEELRLQTENNPGGRPKVFLLTYGHPVWRTARANFSANFFGCAGYEIIDNLGFKTIGEGVEAAKKAGARMVVLCSADEEYATIAPEAKEKLDNETILVVAGAPENMEDLKSKGIEHFIHIKTNLLGTLKQFQQLLGISK